MSSDNEIPQWKKELIARLRRRTAAQPVAGPPQRPVSSEPVIATVSNSAVERCDVVVVTSQGVKMVQDRHWENGSPDSDSSEELRYGPGIVTRLKNKYLSLAQREAASRPSILIRKAASLENILDEDVVTASAVPRSERPFRPAAKAAAPSRYRTGPRSDLKRARSVETISTDEHEQVVRNNGKQRDSFHEEMLIKEGNDGGGRMRENPPPPPSSHRTSAVNRPKRIAPIMNEKEKPPVDVVRQTKLIFERRPEQRTRAPQQTGDVAAKVATYKSIMVQAKAAKKPPIKVKPLGLGSNGESGGGNKAKTNGVRAKAKNVQMMEKAPENGEDMVNGSRKKQSSESKSPPSLPSPIPDVSRIEVKKKSPGDENGITTNTTNLSETPDLIMTSSPLATINSPSFRISATENFIREEIRVANLTGETSPPYHQYNNSIENEEYSSDSEGVKRLGEKRLNLSTNTMTFNFAKSLIQSPPPPNHLLPSVVNRNVSTSQTSPLQPLKLEINGLNGTTTETVRLPPSSPFRAEEVIRSSTPLVSPPKPALTILEIEKNLINAAKTLEQQQQQQQQTPNKNCSASVSIKSEVVTKIKVPKVRKAPSRELENNSIVFKFTDRKDVPDYVHNDGVRRVAAKIEKPKVGEGGIILLPGASIDESFTDEDEEIMRSLEGPPSPCDVTFINDNVLIDGKSSLSQKTKKAKMKISFVEAGPEIYEYPSESSLLIEDIPTSPMTAQIRHSVPSLGGSSSLGNYTPKSTAEEFQPGVTRSIQHSNIPTSKSDNTETTNSTNDELMLQEVEKPILFSTGANSDILF